jgi:hypothetical protein
MRRDIFAMGRVPRISREFKWFKIGDLPAAVILPGFFGGRRGNSAAFDKAAERRG